MSWKWNTEPLSWKDACYMCQRSLRVQADGGVVIWTDGKQYHVSCLLDRLAVGTPPPETAMVESVSHWGLVP